MGGGTVEVIKIASISATNSEHFSRTGGANIENKSLSEFIGSYKIVDFRGVYRTSSEDLDVWVRLYAPTSPRKDIIVYQDEADVINTTSLLCDFIVPTSFTGSGTLDIYAICI